MSRGIDTKKFRSALEQCAANAVFGVKGEANLWKAFGTMPGIEVQGVGTLGWPLNPLVVNGLKQVAKVAPFGKGLETVVDETVRKALEIEGSKVKLNAALDKWVQETAQKCSERLGMGCQVDAKLYKLVVYEEGGMFKEHQDTERDLGAFGTMVLRLPTKHSGGELVLRHREKEMVCFSQSNLDMLSYSVFYADVRHEVRKVTHGDRVTILFNLVKRGSSQTKRKLNDSDQHALCSVAESWPAGKMLILELDHEYTYTNMHVLKGKDWRKIQALKEAKDRNGETTLFDMVHLYAEKQDVAEGGGGWYGDGDWSVYESDTTMSLLGDIQDEFGIDLSDAFVPKETVVEGGGRGFRTLRDLLDDMGDPDEEEVESYMGNSGPTKTFIYRQNYILVWPRAYRLHTLKVLRASSRTRFDALGMLILSDPKLARGSCEASLDSPNLPVSFLEPLKTGFPDLLKRAFDNVWERVPTKPYDREELEVVASTLLSLLDSPGKAEQRTKQYAKRIGLAFERSAAARQLTVRLSQHMIVREIRPWVESLLSKPTETMAVLQDWTTVCIKTPFKDLLVDLFKVAWIANETAKSVTNDSCWVEAILALIEHDLEFARSIVEQVLSLRLTSFPRKLLPALESHLPDLFVTATTECVRGFASLVREPSQFEIEQLANSFESAFAVSSKGHEENNKSRELFQAVTDTYKASPVVRMLVLKLSEKPVIKDVQVALGSRVLAKETLKSWMKVCLKSTSPSMTIALFEDAWSKRSDPAYGPRPLFSLLTRFGKLFEHAGKPAKLRQLQQEYLSHLLTSEQEYLGTKDVSLVGNYVLKAAKDLGMNSPEIEASRVELAAVHVANLTNTFRDMFSESFFVKLDEQLSAQVVVQWPRVQASFFANLVKVAKLKDHAGIVKPWLFPMAVKCRSTFQPTLLSLLRSRLPTFEIDFREWANSYPYMLKEGNAEMFEWLLQKPSAGSLVLQVGPHETILLALSSFTTWTSQLEQVLLVERLDVLTRAIKERTMDWTKNPNVCLRLIDALTLPVPERSAKLGNVFASLPNSHDLKKHVLEALRTNQTLLDKLSAGSLHPNALARTFTSLVNEDIAKFQAIEKSWPNINFQRHPLRTSLMEMQQKGTSSICAGRGSFQSIVQARKQAAAWQTDVLRAEAFGSGKHAAVKLEFVPNPNVNDRVPIACFRLQSIFLKAESTQLKVEQTFKIKAESSLGENVNPNANIKTEQVKVEPNIKRTIKEEQPMLESTSTVGTKRVKLDKDAITK